MAIAEETLSYRDAVGERQRLVGRLRNTEDVDVDELVADVARAKELLAYCGGKIRRADVAIRAIVGELQAGEGTGREKPAGVTVAD